MGQTDTIYDLEVENTDLKKQLAETQGKFPAILIVNSVFPSGID
jgi:hypothetical protein